MAQRFWKGFKKLFTINVEEDSVGEIDAASDFEDYLPIPPVVGAFLSYRPQDIADQLTLIDLKIFKDVTREEVQHSARKDWRNSPNISKLLGGFVSLSTWVQDTLLNTPTVELRSTVLENFILIAHRLHKHKNLHSTKAIMEGLLVEPIKRLASTWKNLSSKNRRCYKKLHRIYSNCQNVEEMMWDAWNSYGVKCIPDIDMMLNSMHDDESINFTCYFVEYLQTSKYDFIGELSWLQDYLRSINYTVVNMRHVRAIGLRKAESWITTICIVPSDVFDPKILAVAPLCSSTPLVCKYIKITAGTRVASRIVLEDQMSKSTLLVQWLFWGWLRSDNKRMFC